MASRTVEIRINVNDLDAVKKLDDLSARLDKLSAKFDALSKKVVTPKVNVDGITAANAEMDKLNAKLDAFGRKSVTARVNVKASGDTFAASVKKAMAQDRRDVESMLSSRSGSSGGPNFFQRLIGSTLFGIRGGGGGGGAASGAENAAGGAAGGGAGGFLSFLGGANNSYTGILYGGLAALAATLAPALIPFGLGTGVGVGGTMLAGRLGATGITKLRADRQALAQAQAALKGKGGNTPSNRLSLSQAQAQLKRDQAKYGGFVPFGHAVNNLGSAALDTFLGALTKPGPGFSAGPHGQQSQSFLQGLTPIFAQLGGFIKSMGPLLGELFRASLPFVKAFVLIMEQFAKAVMPAVLQSMRSLTPFLPQIVKGFVILAQGIASFIKDLGPGMKDSVTVFLGLMTLTKGLLIALAYAADYAAKFFANFGHVSVDVARFVVKQWETLRHNTAVDFDAIRHWVASAWDAIYQNTIARVGRMVQGVMNFDANLRHSIANEYDTIRHGIASAWDTIWNNTKTAVSNGITAVVNFFKGLPAKILGALKSLGSGLMTLGKTALGDMLKGLQSVGGSILSWLKTFIGGIPGAIMKLLHMSPPHPGSAFFDLGANFMHHLEAGIKSRAASVMGAIHGSAGGKIGGSVNSWIIAALHAAGKPMSWLPALQRLVSLESGGNPRAVNPISVLGQHASGLWQMLPSTFYSYGGRGSLFNPVLEGIAALRYISARYGSPFNIPGLFSGGYRGYATGGIITEPILGMGLRSGTTYGFGEHGIHERVTPLGAGGAGGGNVYITVTGDFANPDATGLRIAQVLRQYKQHHGNAVLGIA